MATRALPQLKIQIGNTMNWLFRWLGNKIRDSNDPLRPRWSTSTISSRGDNILSNGMTFTIHRASGGMVVEHSHYDEKTDRTNQSIHIVTDDQELGEQLSKIVTIEMLRR